MPVVLVLAIGLLLARAARAEPELPPLLFPGITDPFAVMPTADAVPVTSIPLRSPPPEPVTPAAATPITVTPPLAPPPELAKISSAEASCVRRDYAGRFMGWMDYKHCVYSGRTLATARWFDDLFGDWHEDEASMMVRVITEITGIQGESAHAKVSVRAKADLPNARRRMRLIISDENDPEEASNREAAGLTRLNRELGQEENRSSVALRWVPFVREAFDTSMDVGVRGIPPDFFVRLRGRRTWSLTKDSIARLEQTFRYGSESRGRSVTELDFERALDANSVLRFANTYDYSQEHSEDGFYWTHTLALAHALGRSRSLSYGVSVNGPTKPEWHSESYGPWVAYRRPFLRPYLFYELVPQYTWYRDLDWEGRASLIVRVEVQFGFRK